MNIRAGRPADAATIAALVRACAPALIEQPGDAAPFWAAMSEAAHAANLASPRFAYVVAEDAECRLLGFVVLRDGTHLFNLFVRPERQRQGIGRMLWQHACRRLREQGHVDAVTVNANLGAVPYYRGLGFEAVGEVVRQHGIAFVPMRLTALPPPDGP